MKASPLFLAAVVLVVAPPTAAQTVRAVLFHLPTCPHCRQVIAEDLPIFFEVYGGPPTVARGDGAIRLLSNGTLSVLFVDASQPVGGPLLELSYASHPVSGARRGVPRMIVGDSILVGSVEIPSRLHALIRNGLATGGIPWPALAGLDTVTAQLERPGVAPPPAPSVPGPTPPAGPSADVGATAPDTARLAPAAPFEGIGAEPVTTVRERIGRDPFGNGVAIVGLGLMVLTLAAVSAGMPQRVGPREPGLWLPVLTLAGAGVAAYLTFIETSGATAICGPVGDCNTVQQSAYARLFGLVPVGALGLAGYGVVLVLWVLAQDGRATATRARRLLVAAALFGTLFSVYLTALEPFVIGATCMWCLTSAMIMTALFWLATAWRDSGAPSKSTKSL